MALKATRKSVRNIDSGYISDAVEAESKKDGSDVAVIVSSPPAHGLDITTVAMDGTNWDFPASEIAESPTLRYSLERIEDLPTPTKRPKRFPILPLDSTLARALGEVEGQSVEEHYASVVKETRPPKTLAKKRAAVDIHGRICTASKTIPQTWAILTTTTPNSHSEDSSSDGRKG